MKVKIQIDSIICGPETQSRSEMNQVVVDEYTEAMRDGAKFPPVVVFESGEEMVLADGFHRVAAARAAGRKSIEAEVRQGGRREAVLFSLGANSSHGLRRTNEDKRKAVGVLLADAEWSEWSNREIAKRAAVDEGTVRRVRGEVTAEVPQSESSNPSKSQDSAPERTYVTKHGSVARMRTSGINAARSDAARSDAVRSYAPPPPPPAPNPPRPELGTGAAMQAARNPEEFRIARDAFKERLATRDVAHYRVFCTAVRRALEANPANIEAIRTAFAALDADVDPWSNGRK